MAKFILSAQAVEDMDVIHSYLCEDNPKAAERVQEAIFEGFALLSLNPGLGRARQFRVRKNLRSWVVPEFANYVIFYREAPDASGIEIVRVLHGRRDLDTLFKQK